MTEFLLGLYIVSVGLTGNTGGLLALLASETGFIPWIVAVAMGYYLWENTPAPEDKPVRMLLGTAVLGIVITENARIKAGLLSAWGQLKAIGNGQGSSNLSSSSQSSVTGGGGFTSKTAFLNSIYPQASAIAQKLNVPVAAVLAQISLETGYGTSHAFSQLNNPAGINIPGGNGSQYQSYPSQAAGINALGNLIQNQYPQSTNTSVEGYFNGLQRGGYATAPNYASTGISIANGPVIQTYLQSIGQ
jgi:hypothetical protein